MTYDYKQKKIVAVINTEIEKWQALNVLGHMAVSLGVNRDDDLMGREILLDASGFGHKGIARYGFIIKSGNSDEISDLIIGAKEVEGITLIDFPKEMLDTRHDYDLCDSMLLKKTEDFKYFGCLLYGLSKEVDTLTKGYALYN